MTQEQFDFLEAVKQNDLVAVRLSLKIAPALVHTCDRTMENGLHWCAKRNYLDIAHLLIQNGIHLAAQNIGNKTAEQLALQFHHFAIVRLIQMEDMHRKKKQSKN